MKVPFRFFISATVGFTVLPPQKPKRAARSAIANEHVRGALCAAMDLLRRKCLNVNKNSESSLYRWRADRRLSVIEDMNFL